MRVYLAGPFFNAEQKATIAHIEAILTTLAIPHFSPSRDQPQLGEDGGSPSEIFHGNVSAMRSCDVMLAWIDDFDPGTIWEIGYFAGYREAMISSRLIVAFTTHGHGLNLMLSRSVNGFISGLPAIRDLFAGADSVAFRNRLHQLTWKGKEV